MTDLDSPRLSPAPTAPTAADARRPRDTGGFSAAATSAATVADLRERGSLKWTAFPDSLGAWVAEMDVLPADAIRAALTAALGQGAYGYLPPALGRRTRTAMADWYARECEWEIPPDDVHLVPDVLEALHVTLDHVAGAGSVAVVTTPAYMPFLTRPRALGHDVVLASARQDDDDVWRHDLATLDAALATASARSRAVGARALLVLCNPWNPVGRVLTRPELLAIADVVERHDALVFSDEIHAPLRFDGLAHIPYASLDERTAAHTITATSASKTWNLAGLKCAQMFASAPQLAAILRRPETLAGVEASTLGALAGAVAFEEGEAWRVALLDYLAGNRALFADAMAGIAGARHTPPEGTYLAWVDLRAARAADGSPLPTDLGHLFRERAGVALTDGALCGAPGFVRVNPATARPILEQIGAAMAGALA